MRLFVVGLGYASSKEGRVAMFIGDMHISSHMVYAQQVVQDKMRDKEEYRNKKANTQNDSGQHKGCSSQSKYQNSKDHAPSSTSALVPRKRGEQSVQNSQKLKARQNKSGGSVAQGVIRAPTCTKCS